MLFSWMLLSETARSEFLGCAQTINESVGRGRVGFVCVGGGHRDQARPSINKEGTRDQSDMAACFVSRSNRRGSC